MNNFINTFFMNPPSNRRKGYKNNKQYKAFRKACFRQHKNKCVASGLFEDLVMHHVINYAEDIELRLDLDNVVPMNIGYHELFHNIYGRSNNNKSQLIQFCNDIKQMLKLNKQNNLDLNYFEYKLLMFYFVNKLIFEGAK